MRIEGSDAARQQAAGLRRAMTAPEVARWLALRRNDAGLRFRRQHAAGRYVLDFYCAPARLVIEVDGEAHSRGDRPLRDAARDEWLRSRDLRVLRIPAADVLSNLDGVTAGIVALALQQRDQFASVPPPSPSVALRAPPPPGGGG